VEHRFYGSSLPFGNRSFSPEALQYLTIEQALADYSLLLAKLPRILGCTGTAFNRASGLCDTILFGGSYGGMLAAWHRFKYPHLSVGAVASGAPVDFYPGGKGSQGVQAAFYKAYVATFSKYGGAEGCGAALETALRAADNATETQLLEAGIKPCSDTAKSNMAEQFAFYAKGAVSSLAMIDYPYPCSFITPLPANPVQKACAILTTEKNPLTALNMALLLYVNATGDLPCLSLADELVGRRTSIHTQRLKATDLGVTAWNYQACTELLLEPITSNGYGFYPEADSQLSEVVANCVRRFQVQPRPSWMPLAFGRGHDYRLFSNIIFMENEKDPWHVGTATISAVGGVNGTVTRIVSKGGAHHQDLRFSSPYDTEDVHKARAYEKSTIQKWLSAL